MAIDWELQVGGVDLAAKCDRTFALSQIAFPRASRLTFRVDDPTGTVDIDEEDEVLLLHDTARVFVGRVKVLGRTDVGVTSHRAYEIEAQDDTSLLVDDVVDDAAGNHAGGISDRDMIIWLIDTYGTKGITADGNVATLRASMPAIDFRGMNLFEALEAICKVTGGFFYVRYDLDKNLLYNAIRDVAAPFALSDAPDGVTTYGYWDFNVPSNTTELVNAVYVIGTGIADWVEEAASIALYDRHAGSLREPAITTSGALEDRGEAFLALNAWPKESGGFKTAAAGLRAGMTVELTHDGWGLAAEPYPIAQLDVRPAGPDRIEYTVRVGEPSRTLRELVERVHGGIGDVNDRIDDIEDECGCGPFVCEPTDFRVPWAVQGISGSCAIDPLNPSDSCFSDDVGAEVTLVIGATYRVEWTVFFGAQADQLTAILDVGAGQVDHYMGSTINGTNITFASEEFVAGHHTAFVGLQHGGPVGYFGGGSTVSCTVYYVAGPDARFEGQPVCSNGEPKPGQWVPITVGLGDGVTTDRVAPFPYKPDSFQVWVDDIEQTSAVDETDPTTGAWSLAFVVEPDETLRFAMQRA